MSVSGDSILLTKHIIFLFWRNQVTCHSRHRIPSDTNLSSKDSSDISCSWKSIHLPAYTEKQGDSPLVSSFWLPNPSLLCPMLTLYQALVHYVCILTSFTPVSLYFSIYSRCPLLTVCLSKPSPTPLTPWSPSHFSVSKSQSFKTP